MILLLLLAASWADTALDNAGVPSGQTDYLLVEVSSGKVVAEKWSEPYEASPGSLLKPFVALAYARKYGLNFPRNECTGTACWLPSGHGRIGIEEAIAQSCNAYFRRLATGVSPAEVGLESSRLGMRQPPPDGPRDALWGLSPEWQAGPRELLNAYVELARRSAEPASAIVLRGLHAAAQSGTASALAALDQPSYAKTGTAPCAHAASADGDGYAVALYPAGAPRYALIVRLHGRTGRSAASAAAAILSALLAR